MNEQLQQAIASLIQQSIIVFQQGATFLSAELPDVIHQLLIWKALESFIPVFFIGIILPCFLVYFNIKQIKWWAKDVKNKWGETEPRICTNTGPFCMLNIIHIPLFIWIYNSWNLIWLQIIVSPKVYLLEYASKLFK